MTVNSSKACKFDPSRVNGEIRGFKLNIDMDILLLQYVLWP